MKLFSLIWIFSFLYSTVPPDRPIIYEIKRSEKAKNVEAYNEGSDVLLTCEVTGGEYWNAEYFFKQIKCNKRRRIGKWEFVWVESSCE